MFFFNVRWGAVGCVQQLFSSIDKFTILLFVKVLGAAEYTASGLFIVLNVTAMIFQVGLISKAGFVEKCSFHC